MVQHVSQRRRHTSVVLGRQNHKRVGIQDLLVQILHLLRRFARIPMQRHLNKRQIQLLRIENSDIEVRLQLALEEVQRSVSVATFARRADEDDHCGLRSGH